MKHNKNLDEKRRKLIPDIIFTYVNTHLRGYPENLHDIFKVFRDDCDVLFDLEEEETEKRINAIIELSKVNESNIDEYNNRIRDIISKLSQSPDPEIKRIFEFYGSCPKYTLPMINGDLEVLYNPVSPIDHEVYKYYYPKTSSCPCDLDRQVAIDNDLFRGPDRLKCFECDQEYFIYIFNSIAQGGFHEAIARLSSILHDCSEHWRLQFKVDNKRVYKTITEITYKTEDQYAPPKLFNRLMDHFLLEFLSDFNPNKEYIKRCSSCNKFFKTTYSLKKTCGDQCKTAHKSSGRTEQRKKQKKAKRNLPKVNSI